MDDLRGFDFDPDETVLADDASAARLTDARMDGPPPIIGQDERRMQVRAYNYWAGLLGKRRFPLPDRLLAGDQPDFASHAVVLHFDTGLEDPMIVALGGALAEECGTTAQLARLSHVPGLSVVSRITDHYLQIIANEAPIGFEAEYSNHRGATILYRGILLPFSSNDQTIDYICGVINWKELADQQTTDALMRAIGTTLTSASPAMPEQRGVPARGVAMPDSPAVPARGTALLEKRVSRARSIDRHAPIPHAAVPNDDWSAAEGGWADGPGADGLAADTGAMMHDHADAAMLDLAPFLDGPGFLPAPLPASLPAPSADTQPGSGPAPMSLVDWLEKARASALRARASDDRTRAALYAAIGRAWDFALAAAIATDDFARLVKSAGLVMQDRAPLIPLMKLVFGSDYDKTRLTEYATVLAHAQRIGLNAGTLGDYLATAPGGLKAIVAAERAARRGEIRAADASAAEPAWLRRARSLPGRPLTDVSADGAEFALVMVRRLPGNDPTMLGEITRDANLLARAARYLQH